MVSPAVAIPSTRFDNAAPCWLLSITTVISYSYHGLGHRFFSIWLAALLVYFCFNLLCLIFIHSIALTLPQNFFLNFGRLYFHFNFFCLMFIHPHWHQSS